MDAMHGCDVLRLSIGRQLCRTDRGRLQGAGLQAWTAEGPVGCGRPDSSKEARFQRAKP